MKEEREGIEKAIRHLEEQRGHLGDSAVDIALAGLKQRLLELTAPEQLEGKNEPSSAERRVVTVLFCDVAGSTALAEGMDPEEWTGIMNVAFKHLIEPVERYEGTVSRLMGDAILAFFGAPIAHEDDPQRAVLAGLAIIDSIAPFSEELKNDRGINFNVRVGINTGLAVVGDVGSETIGEYTAMGDAVNVAARMEQTAAPGTVQIAEDTYSLITPLFEFEELGGITVKGKSEKVPAYRVISQKFAPGSLRGLTASGIRSPIVGRESELESAKRAYDQLLAGQGGILAILGEAGIGKSRLITELQKITREADSELRQSNHSRNPTLWLEGQTISYSQTISYWPFQQIFRQYAGISDDDSESRALHKLEEKIRHLFADEADEITPYLASLLAIEAGSQYSERIKYLDGEALGQQVYRASRLFFERLADQNPLVLLFDDLHWMDTSSAGLLEHLLPLVNRVPLLICGISRPDPKSHAAGLLDIAEARYEDKLSLIELEPLTPSESSSLVENLLEIDGLPLQSLQMILEKADGNPYYLEEILRELIDDGALVKDSSSGQWQVTKQITRVAVPDTIQGLLIARIDRLDENLKHVVYRAAVIGRTFLYRILNTVLVDEIELDQKLSRLQSIELIQEKQRIPELEYIFTHALAHEAAYDSILLKERRQVHAQVGNAIEKLMAERLDEFYGLLAYHYSAAEKWEKAQEYLFKAGDQASRMAADSEALALYHQAMEAYTLVRGDDWEPIERARLERKIGEAFYRLGDFRQARIYLTRSLALLGEVLPESKWGVRLAIFGAILTQLIHRFFPGFFVRPMSDAPNQVAEEIFNASLAIGWIEGVADIERFLLVAIRTLNASEREGYAYGSAYLASSLSNAVDLMGWHNLVDRYYRLGKEYSRHVSPERPVIQLDWSRAFHHNMQANFEKSLEHALLVGEAAQRAGDMRLWGSAMDMTSWAYLSQGRLIEAHDTCLEMIAVAEDGSDQQVISWGLLGLGVTRRRLGQIDEAISDLERAIEVSELVPDFHTQVAASGWLGRCYVAQGEIEQAITTMETSQEVLAAQAIVMEIAILNNGLSEAYLAAAESSSDKNRKDWLNKAKRSCLVALSAGKRYRPPLADALMYRGRYEWLQGNFSAAEKWWGKAMQESQLKGDRFEEGVIHLEIGRRMGDSEHLQLAESIFKEIGAELDLVAARDAQVNREEIC